MAMNSVGRAALDAAGTGIGFIIALTMVGGIREVLGNGTFLGVPLFGPGFEPWIVMILPPGGFFSLGVLLLIFAAWEERKSEPVGPRDFRVSVTRQVGITVPAAGEGGEV